MLSGDNLGLIFMRQVALNDIYSHFGISKILVDNRAFYSNKGIMSYAPLYLYPTEEAAKQKSLLPLGVSPWPPDEANGGRVPNLNPAFVRAMEEKWGLVFRPYPPTPSPQEGKGSDSPPPTSGEGLGEGVDSSIPGKGAKWQTLPELWRKLKPLARQMRREPTPAEDKLWQQLRGKKLLGLKFRRQHAIDRFIVDFYCREARLIIEVDGPIHDYTQEEDKIRQEFLESQGYRVLRFSNEQVLTEIEGVLETIALALRPHPPISWGGLGEGVFTPEDIFHYIYAIFHSPTYRSRYAEFLKIDFPRLPLTSDVELFRSLCGLGRELVGLHLLESPQVGQFITRYPIVGDNRVEKGYPKYAPPKEGQPGRVNINKSQYFEGVPPEVWQFHIGGYQVLDKWLKDRQGRQLSYDDLTHYQKVMVALQKTIELMEKIDTTISKWPIE
jgi:very-short-patch-repair endonuclease